MSKSNFQKVLFAFGAVLFIYAFYYAVILFFHFDLGDVIDTLSLKEPNEIGDTVGGILNPLFAISICIFTGLAFYAQYEANKQVQQQFKIQQFESQFYEMIRLHKENINSIKYNSKSGHLAIEQLYNELRIIDKNIVSKFGMEKSIIVSYEIFYNGVSLPSKFIREREPLNYRFDFQELDEIRSKKQKQIDYYQHYLFYLFKQQFFADFRIDNSNSEIIQNKNSILGHYYRHLYQTVGMVAHNSYLDYNQKRTYLKQLRAQLSEFEQVLLFYNWLSGQKGGYYGAYWEERNIKDENGKLIVEKDRENGKNYYFTDYRMIKNVFNLHIFDDYGKEIYKFMYNSLEPEKDFEKIKNKSVDNLFDNQDFD